MRLRLFAAAALATSGLALGACSAERSEAAADAGSDKRADSTTDASKVWEPVHSPMHHQLVNSLADSFDAPSCRDAQLRYAGRKEGAQTVFHQRRFDAPDQCLSDLEGAVQRLGFAQEPSGAWNGTITQGTAERMSFLTDPDGAVGNLLWEVDVT